jgi:hypothetical protein
MKIPSEITCPLKYFDPTVQGKAYQLNDYVWPAYNGDLGEKITTRNIHQGRTRTFYYFNDV